MTYRLCSPPRFETVSMIITLERAGLMGRKPGAARSIQLLIDPGALPPLLPARSQPVKTTVHGYYCLADRPS